ncbi:rCG34000 [Rattus norvegicus]|uniref:RCG34000 n=1 Tax=Rattus norvegicus TaxID=10116 RepID=A6HJQ7_RAT|nr:rCG34000 [Rattus norvegicus]
MQSQCPAGRQPGKCFEVIRVQSAAGSVFPASVAFLSIYHLQTIPVRWVSCHPSFPQLRD